MPVRFISHYEIVRQLGSGGMAEVYLAQDTQLERLVALKVMSAELAKDSNQRKRFRTEAKAASGLNHPHICVIYEVGETSDQRPYLAMEYLEGRPLDAVLQHRRLEITEILELGVQVAEALEAAHARGLVHRDIKPANLMLDPKSGAKVLDFGLAKWFAEDALAATGSSAALTGTGMLIGTPQYMSPEQALGRRLDPRTDIFSLGVVLYELVAGQRPFLGATVGESINNIINQPAAPLFLEHSSLHQELDRIILECLEKNPEDRYPSAKELAADLRRLAEGWHRASPPEALGTPATRGQALAPGDRQPTALWKLLAGSPRRTPAKSAWFWGIAALTAGLVGSWVLVQTHGTRPNVPSANPSGAADQKSVAVLPFANLSPEKADEYLSDGMTEELLNALTKVKGLRVPGRSSSFAFKGKNEEGIFRKVGAQLNVGAVLEGSVRKAGNQLRITAQLVNVADGFHLWSETYDRDLTNIFAIQSDIASRVAEALQVRLLGAVQESTRNIEAYEYYLRGRYLWNRRTAESLVRAMEFFNRAIAADPAYAVAYAGLADCYQVLPNYQATEVREVEARSRAAALKALELDPTLAAPHATLASLKETYNWDWRGAEADYRRSIELDAHYPSARQWYAESLCFQGRRQEAIREARIALDLDPLSPVINAMWARILADTGAPKEAVALLRKQLAADSSFAPAHSILGWTLLAQGRPHEAIPEYEEAMRLNENVPSAELGFCYARVARTAEANKVLGQFLELERQGKDMHVALAMVHHGFTNDVQAFDCLDRALEKHSYFMQLVPVNPCWKDVRSQPRFQAILKKMNLTK